MAIYVHVTESCLENAITHGLHEELERFVVRVEKAQSLALFDTDFPPPFLVKRKFGGRQGRLIARDVRLAAAEDHTVVVLLAMMIRGTGDYDQFGHNPIEYGNRRFNDLYSEEGLFEWLAERIKKPVIEKDRPSDVEQEVLFSVTGAATSEQDWTVAETREWTRRVRETPVAANLGPLREAIVRLVDSAQKGTAEGGMERATGNWSICWSSNRESRLLVLEDVVPTTATQPVSSGDATVQSKDDILKRCRRAYLDVVLADEKQWLEIEEDTEGNLALSPEEQQVLDSVRMGIGGFPLFINGRAGSGKSTILQYLFADYVMKYIEDLDAGRLSVPPKRGLGKSRWPTQGPVYFTCSKDLLQRAQVTVEQLLLSGARFWHKAERQALFDRQRAEIQRAFCELRPYLLSVVAPEHVARFDEKNYISYPRFRRLWWDKFGRSARAQRDHGAAISWHVIRTHIKGATADDVVDPDEFEQLDKKQRSVSREAFERIYLEVWDRWYHRKCEGEMLWDDQDLARHLLETGCAKPAFHAIFADEAQDFTSVELSLMLRLSAFSDRKLARAEVGRVPFVFAGDPFQTLNPTGFRWEAAKASFFRNFVFALDPLGDPEATLNYHELGHNYRSSRSIVGFSNLVQARRAQLFKLKQIKPQQPWSSDDHATPVHWFRRDDEAFWREFAKQKDLVLIVPCAEGEEAEFVQKDSHLKNRVQINHGVPENVWSAVRAKGLEFDRVVVYGFGTSEISEGAKELAQWMKRDQSEREEGRLPCEYFFNQLYVAVSRPKHALFVVDSEQGLKSFWDFAAAGASDRMLKDLPGGGEAWRKLIAQMVEGETSHLISNAYDPQKQAEEFEEQGLNTDNGYLLKQAAFHYRNAGTHGAADRCDAQADLFDGRFLEAGRAFLAQRRWDEAVRAFWMGGADGRRELLRLGRDQAELMQTVQFRIAHAISSETVPVANWTDVLHEAARESRQRSQNWRLEDRKAWAEAVLQAVGRLIDKKPEEAVPADWLACKLAVEQAISERLTAIEPLAMARLLARSRDFLEAKRHFDNASEDNLEQVESLSEYWETRAETDDYPERLIALDRLGKLERVYAEWSAAGRSIPDGGAFPRIIGRALKFKGELSEALPLLAEHSNSDTLIEIGEAFVEKGDRDGQRRAFQCAAVFLGSEGQWDRLVRLGDGEKAPLNKDKAIQNWARENRPDFLTAFKCALACRQAPWEGDERLAKRMVAMVQETWTGEKRRAVDALRLVGSALEKTGRYAPAREFYERSVKEFPQSPENEDVRRWARERLLKVRWKMTLLEERKNPETARSDRLLLQKEQEKFMLRPIADIPDWPEPLDVTKIVRDMIAATTVSTSSDTEEASMGMDDREGTATLAPHPVRPEPVTLFGVELRLVPDAARLNIERISTGERASFFFGRDECSGEGEFARNEPGVWESKDWGLELRFASSGAHRAIVVRWPERRMEIRLEVGATAARLA